MSRAGIQAGWCAGLVLLCGVTMLGAQPAADADPVRARAFEVHYRSLADAADLVMDLLSDDGQVTSKPRLKVLVVQDRVSVLDRVQSLLESYDLAPRGVRLTVALFLGTQAREDEASEARQRRGVIDLPAVGTFTKWKDYESLGSRSVQGTEGERMTADLSETYRVIFTVERVDERQGVVKLDRLALQHLEGDGAGGTRVEELYSMGIAVDIGKQQIVGAASGPDAESALFLTLLAEAR